MNHNARNQRVRTNVGSVATEFVFNAQGQRASVWNGTTKTVLRGQYFWGVKPVADYSGGQTHFQHQDWLRTEHLRTTYNGGVESPLTSLPFGDGPTTETGSDPYYFAAVDFDTATNTDHAQFRQYNSTQGHWMRPDPYYRSYDFSNPQSFNRYAYALNNPLSAVDPKGLECVWDDGSYDAADDPDTGSPDQCSNAGGTWVDPEIFENYLLTNGQPPNIPYGSWSDQPDPTLVSSWLTASATLDIFDAEPAVASMLQDFQNIGFYAGQPDFTPFDVFNWAVNPHQNPVGCASGPIGCIYHYGNWCGAGGSGNPVDATDASCMVHDFLYYKYGYKAADNWNAYNPLLQEINQALCDSVGPGAISGYFGSVVQIINDLTMNWMGNPSCN